MNLKHQFILVLGIENCVRWTEVTHPFDAISLVRLGCYLLSVLQASMAREQQRSGLATVSLLILDRQRFCWCFHSTTMIAMLLGECLWSIKFSWPEPVLLDQDVHAAQVNTRLRRCHKLDIQDTSEELVHNEDLRRSWSSCASCISV